MKPSHFHSFVVSGHGFPPPMRSPTLDIHQPGFHLIRISHRCAPYSKLINLSSFTLLFIFLHYMNLSFPKPMHSKPLPLEEPFFLLHHPLHLHLHGVALALQPVHVFPQPPYLRLLSVHLALWETPCRRRRVWSKPVHCWASGATYDGATPVHIVAVEFGLLGEQYLNHGPHGEALVLSCMKWCLLRQFPAIYQPAKTLPFLLWHTWMCLLQKAKS